MLYRNIHSNVIYDVRENNIVMVRSNLKSSYNFEEFLSSIKKGTVKEFIDRRKAKKPRKERRIRDRRKEVV